MLVPQFTIRRMFWLITALAVLFAVMALAFRGFFLARSLVGVISMLAVCFCVFALIYAAAAAFVGIAPKKTPTVDSPFARHSLPPRYVAPENE
jgi:hypothetical protein